MIISLDDNIYTFIMYRADGVDTCRSCVMGTSPSDFLIETEQHIESVVDSLVSVLWDDYIHRQDREYCHPEIHILKGSGEIFNFDDGYSKLATVWIDSENESGKYIRDNALVKLSNKIEVDMNKEQKALLEKVTQQAATQAAKELQELERLKKKYEVK